MATHSSNFALEISCTEELSGYSPCSHKELDMIKVTYLLPLPERGPSLPCSRWSRGPWVSVVLCCCSSVCLSAPPTTL